MLFFRLYLLIFVIINHSLINLKNNNIIQVPILPTDSTKLLAVCSQFYYECEILTKSAQNPNIINLIGLCANGTQPILVYEKLPIELSNSLELMKIIDHGLYNRFHLILEITKAIKYLHHDIVLNGSIVHGNITPAVIGINQNDEVKITNLGLCLLIREKSSLIQDFVHSVDYRYAAPEILLGENICEKCDVYSFGMLAWFIMSSAEDDLSLFAGMDAAEHHKRVVRKHERPICNPVWPKEFIQLLQLCWKHKRYDRPSFEYILITMLQIFRSNFDDSIETNHSDLIDGSLLSGLQLPSIASTTVGKVQSHDKLSQLYPSLDMISGGTIGATTPCMIASVSLCSSPSADFGGSFLPAL